MDRNGILSIFTTTGHLFLNQTINKIEIKKYIDKNELSNKELLKEFSNNFIYQIKQIGRGFLVYFSISPIVIESIFKLNEMIYGNRYTRFYTNSLNLSSIVIKFFGNAITQLPLSVSALDLFIKKPKQTLESTILFTGFQFLQNGVIDSVLFEIQKYCFHLFLYIQENNNNKSQFFSIILRILTNPLFVSLIQAIIATPFKNISSQYYKYLVDSLTGKPVHADGVPNPVTIAKDLQNERGVNGFYRGFLFSYASFLLNNIYYSKNYDRFSQ